MKYKWQKHKPKQSRVEKDLNLCLLNKLLTKLLILLDLIKFKIINFLDYNWYLILIITIAYYSLNFVLKKSYFINYEK